MANRQLGGETGNGSVEQTENFAVLPINVFYDQTITLEFGVPSPYISIA